jgi:hypothetical protein
VEAEAPEGGRCVYIKGRGAPALTKALCGYAVSNRLWAASSTIRCTWFPTYQKESGIRKGDFAPFFVIAVKAPASSSGFRTP